jgi:hypothetical protein
MSNKDKKIMNVNLKSYNKLKFIYLYLNKDNHICKDAKINFLKHSINEFLKDCENIDFNNLGWKEYEEELNKAMQEKEKTLTKNSHTT